jgi:hypothetical protein|tara:strand:+ start:131 stop:541 length:411 start_codon:yes stop_codon:yes gene_type:complete
MNQQQKQLVLEELNLYFNDFKLGIERVFKYKKVKVYKNFGYEFSKFNRFFSIGSNSFDCCWGTKDNQGKNSKIYYIRKKNFILVRCGIEVLNDIEDKRMLGKGFTIKELKQRCKENKLKGYSKLDKLKLIKLLMTI